jgi:hypothetical protein
VGTTQLYDATSRHDSTTRLYAISKSRLICWLDGSYDARHEHDDDADVVANKHAATVALSLTEIDYNFSIKLTRLTTQLKLGATNKDFTRETLPYSLFPFCGVTTQKNGVVRVKTGGSN